MKLEKGTFAFDGPVKYRICVRGILLFDWSDRLGGLMMMSAEPEGPDSTIVFEGWMADQAALSGVLNTLYNLHLSLISVEALADEIDSTSI